MSEVEVDTGLLAELARVAALPRLIVALDFDGTLAPLVDDPATSRTIPSASGPLTQLALDPSVCLALVSGRDLTDLLAVAQPCAGTTVIGSHGAQWALMTEQGVVVEPWTLPPEREAALAKAARAMNLVVATRRGVWLERKPAAVVVHTRRAESAEIAELAQAEAAQFGRVHGLHVLAGNNVVELAVLTTTKGDAMTRLRQEYAANAAVYIGDDRTDEDAFSVLCCADRGGPDLAIKVGSGTTRAAFRVSGPAEVAAALSVLARARLLGSHPPN